MKMEQLISLAENRDAKDVRRQQIGGKLNSLELRIDRASQRLGQGGFSCAGEVLQ